MKRWLLAAMLALGGFLTVGLTSQTALGQWGFHGPSLGVHVGSPGFYHPGYHRGAGWYSPWYGYRAHTYHRGWGHPYYHPYHHPYHHGGGVTIRLRIR